MKQEWNIKDKNGNYVGEEEVLLFLDALRESGITNMYGASPYVADAFNLKETEAKKALAYWIQTFDSRHH